MSKTDATAPTTVANMPEHIMKKSPIQSGRGTANRMGQVIAAMASRLVQAPTTSRYAVLN